MTEYPIPVSELAKKKENLPEEIKAGLDEDASSDVSSTDDTDEIGAEKSLQVLEENEEAATSRSGLDDIISSLGQIVNSSISNELYLVEGNYSEENVQRLRIVQTKLNERDDTIAFLASDLPSDVNVSTKWMLLAAHADAIIFVVERSNSSLGIELGMLMRDTMSESSYFDKCYIFNRKYEQTNDLLYHDMVNVLRQEGRVFEWETEKELYDLIDEIP